MWPSRSTGVRRQSEEDASVSNGLRAVHWSEAGSTRKTPATESTLSIEVYRDVFAHYAGWDWRRVMNEARSFKRRIGDFNPAYLEESRGIAEGMVRGWRNPGHQRSNRGDVRAKTRQAMTGSGPPECSAFAALPAASAVTL